MISNKGGRAGAAPGIKRLVLSEDTQIISRRNAQIWIKKEKWLQEGKTGKGEKGKGNGKKKSVMFACLEEETDPRSEEIPESGVNTSYRHINLENVLGRNDWDRKNWEKECSSISDAGFNGWAITQLLAVEYV